MRSYGTHWNLIVAFGSFARSSASRCAMNAVSRGGCQRTQRTCAANHACTSTNSASSATSKRAAQRPAEARSIASLRQAPGRNSANTGFVSGRTPRHSEKLSAACSISMPMPSEAPAAPCSRAQRMNAVGRSE